MDDCKVYYVENDINKELKNLEKFKDWYIYIFK